MKMSIRGVLAGWKPFGRRRKGQNGRNSAKKQTADANKMRKKAEAMGESERSTNSQEDEMAEMMRGGIWKEVHLDEKGEEVEEKGWWEEVEEDEKGEEVAEEEEEEEGEKREAEEDEKGEQLGEGEVEAMTATKCEHPWVEYSSGSWSVIQH